ncbi:MAG TPA: protein-methionine-sulfoxide reductase catalytic subunit MsrP [Pyrinomonadaceae bacterium]|nr:protein-methionine-sulfoxide reductase catalytic subunit MsrP [Pyrinomonadaceae bacterium]
MWSKNSKISANEVTPESVFLNRRNFIKAVVFAGSTLATAGLYRYFSPAAQTVVTGPFESERQLTIAESGERTNTFEEITNYNNFYEFSTSKTAVARKAVSFVTRPWTVEVNGLVQRPATFDIEQLLKIDQEERVYRFRCVEAWSMVIPWLGFPLKTLLDRVEPLSTAKYVAFESFYDPEQMQSSFSAGIDFPYVEGLRLDEAYHPLTILATGLYGKPMPNQNGAPIRLVVPWKYGFKSIKSVVRITLTDREPPTTWNIAGPEEYGFYSNVNPEVDHPRWSQGSERRIGEYKMRKTLLFNGYADDVAHLYNGMDLKKYF